MIVVLVLEVVDTAHASVSLALVTILLSGFMAFWRFNRYGMDPLALFCSIFLLYDGVLLFRLTTVGDAAVLVYPTTFSTETYSAAGTLCVIAMATVMVTSFVWESTVEPRRVKQATVLRGTAGRWFWCGFALYSVGVVLYGLQFQQFGGYFAALAMQRGEKFEMAGAATLLSYPYLAFVIPGIACMCYGAECGERRKQRMACYGLVGFWCLLVLLQGDRRLVVQAALTVIGILSVVRPAALKFRTRTWVLLAAGYCAFSIFGYARGFISSIASGQATSSEVLSSIGDDWTSDWLTPEHTEFAGPYLSLLSAVSEQTQPLFGSSYYESFLTVLPKFMYPGQKPELLTHRFDEKMHIGHGPISGWGYNPVAEAYVNFGTAGVALVFALWAIYFLLIGYVRQRGVWGTLCGAVLLSEAINANRIDFRNVYWESSYFLAGLVVAAIFNMLFSKLSRPAPRMNAI